MPERYELRFEHRFEPTGGVDGAVRLELLRDHAVYWMYLDLGADGFVAIRHDDVALPRGGLLELRADGLWAELVCEVPDEHWTFGLEAFGLRFENREEARTADFGERLPVGFDLEWDTGRVVGVLLVGARRIAVDGPGSFRHDDGEAPTVAWSGWIG
jgi:hypothetical protein